MTADFGFISYAAQSHTDKLAVCRTGNGLTETRLTDAGRAHQAKNRRLHLINTGLNGEVFENTFLHLFQPIVIGFKDVACFLEVLAHAALLRPGKRQKRIEVASNDGRFSRHRRHHAKFL